MMGDLLVPSGGCRTIKQQRTLRAILSQSRGQSNQSILGSPGRPVNSTAFTLTTNSAGMVTVNQFSQSSQSSYCPEGRTPSSSHSFKFANNDSPLPEDRMFMDANYYNDVNHGSNRAAGITDPIDAYQQTFGFEKTVVFGEASWGMSLPVNLLVDNSGGNTTVNVGNLTVFGKMILWEDQGDDADATLTGGLAVTIPTGPNGFAGARVDGGINDTTIQPYFGYVYRTGSWYLLGFSSLDIPTETADTLMFYNDFSVCYLIPTNLVRGNVKGLIPTLELHVNTPLTHRSDGTLFDPAATPDWLDLTFGFTTLLAGNSSLGLGINVPVTGPLPYTWEGLAQFTMRF